MLQTIMIGGHISVQGFFVKEMADGRVIVRVGRSEYCGLPVAKMAA